MQYIPTQVFFDYKLFDKMQLMINQMSI